MSTKYEYSEDWFTKLPPVVYKELLPYLNSTKMVPKLRETCRFFRDKYKVNKYSDINFKSKDPKTQTFKLAQFGHKASLVCPLRDGRFVVIGNDSVISIMGCTNPQEGVLSEQLELRCEPLEYNYEVKFLVAELPNNILLVMNHHTFNMWDISPSEEPESRSIAGIYDFDTTSSATCLVNLSPKYTAFGFENNKIYIMNMKAGRIEKEITTQAPVRELSINFEGKLIAVCESENFVVSCFDPKKGFEQTDLGVLRPMRVIENLKLSRIIVRNNHIYSEQYLSDYPCETLHYSERVNNTQWQLEPNKLGAFKSYMDPDATAVFWDIDEDSQDLWIQVKEYPRTAPEFSF